MVISWEFQALFRLWNKSCRKTERKRLKTYILPRFFNTEVKGQPSAPVYLFVAWKYKSSLIFLLNEALENFTHVLHLSTEPFPWTSFLPYHSANDLFCSCKRRTDGKGRVGISTRAPNSRNVT